MKVLTTPEIQKQMEVYQKYQGRPMFYGHHGEWCDCLDDELVVKTSCNVSGNRSEDLRM